MGSKTMDLNLSLDVFILRMCHKLSKWLQLSNCYSVVVRDVPMVGNYSPLLADTVLINYEFR